MGGHLPGQRQITEWEQQQRDYEQLKQIRNDLKEIYNGDGYNGDIDLRRKNNGYELQVQCYGKPNIFALQHPSIGNL